MGNRCFACTRWGGNDYYFVFGLKGHVRVCGLYWLPVTSYLLPGVQISIGQQFIGLSEFFAREPGTGNRLLVLKCVLYLLQGLANAYRYIDIRGLFVQCFE